MKKKKRKSLQPWLEYFGMLRAYEQKDLLLIMPDKGEAYVTHPALYAMTEGDNPLRQLAAIPRTARRIRAYAGFKSAEGPGYLLKPFALHVVEEQQPHDLRYTVLLRRRRRWWSLWFKVETVDVFDYTERP